MTSDFAAAARSAIDAAQVFVAKKYHSTDLGNAERLIDRFGADLRYCKTLGGWHHWDGCRWTLDNTGAVERMAQNVARELYREAGDITDPDTRSAMAKFAISCENASRQRAMLDLAWSQQDVAVEPGVFDANPWLLNVRNGTIDLHAGTLREHRRDDLLTKVAPVDYDPDATAPTWLRHLAMFLPDANTRRQVQRDLGMALVGETLEEILPIWWGAGANGKSTTAQVLQRVLGDYAQSAAPDLLVVKHHESHPTEIADLRGSRLVFSVEIGENRKLDEAKVKMLTGGDRKKTRLMNRDFFEIEQTFTIAMLVNHQPIITGADDAIWRRVRLVPWTVRITEEARLPQAEIQAALLAEAPGILRWLLDGLADWHNDHHWLAPQVVEATTNYREEQDSLGSFLSEYCDIGPRYTVAVGSLYSAYESWSKDTGEDALGIDRLR